MKNVITQSLIQTYHVIDADATNDSKIQTGKKEKHISLIIERFVNE